MRLRFRRCRSHSATKAEARAHWCSPPPRQESQGDAGADQQPRRWFGDTLRASGDHRAALGRGRNFSQHGVEQDHVAEADRARSRRQRHETDRGEDAVATDPHGGIQQGIGVERNRAEQVVDFARDEERVATRAEKRSFRDADRAQERGVESEVELEGEEIDGVPDEDVERKRVALVDGVRRGIDQQDRIGGGRRRPQYEEQNDQ